MKIKIFLILVLIFFVVDIGIFLNEYKKYESRHNLYYMVINNEKNLIDENKFYSITENINFELSETEKEDVLKIINNINPIYLNKQKNITFTNNISKYCENCSGINFNDGENIYIEYVKNTMRLKEVICHELLHSYIRSIGQELEEEIVDDLEEYLFCFQENGKRKN